MESKFWVESGIPRRMVGIHSSLIGEYTVINWTTGHLRYRIRNALRVNCLSVAWYPTTSRYPETPSRCNRPCISCTPIQYGAFQPSNVLILSTETGVEKSHQLISRHLDIINY